MEEFLNPTVNPLIQVNQLSDGRFEVEVLADLHGLTGDELSGILSVVQAFVTRLSKAGTGRTDVNTSQSDS
ncbi:hypothetical protein LCGC14_1259200 [marine sediment metagenome]|uniref:Uncharacterized protein n=1 Tax=marine sediment metagenome TaxID=412755 RepID=A0A0F9P4K5_9ZZZZ